MKNWRRQIRIVLIFSIAFAIFFSSFSIISKWPQKLSMSHGGKIYLSPDDRYFVLPNSYLIANVFDRYKRTSISIEPDKDMYFSFEYAISFILFTKDANQLIVGGSTYKRDDWKRSKGQHWIMLWDLKARKKIRKIVCKKPVGSEAVLLHDNRTIAYDGIGGGIQFLDIKSGKPIGFIPPLPKNTGVTSLAISPNGKHLAVAYSFPNTPDKQIHAYVNAPEKESCGLLVWDIDNEKILWSQGSKEKKLEFNAICAAFSPDSKTFAIKGSDIQLRFFDVNDGRLIRSFTTTYYLDENSIHSPVFVQQLIDFSPDGNFIATGGNQVDIWNLSDGSLRSHLDGVGPVKFASDGSFLVSEVVKPQQMFGGTPDDGPIHNTILWKRF